MRITRLFIDHSFESNSLVTLDRDKSHYLVTVLRLEPGTRLHVFNGKGGFFEAEVTKASKLQCCLSIGKHATTNNESPADIHLGIGLSRPEKVDFILQKCTELGVKSFTPVITAHSEFRLKGEKLEKKIKHWEKVISSACEQCQRNLLPTLMPVFKTLDDYADSRPENALKIMLDHRAPESLSTLLEQNSSNAKPVHLVIGPEGGFSEQEILGNLNKGFVQAHMGPRVLRTETAPIAALAIFQSMLGDFR